MYSFSKEDIVSIFAEFDDIFHVLLPPAIQVAGR